MARSAGNVKALSNADLLAKLNAVKKKDEPIREETLQDTSNSEDVSFDYLKSLFGSGFLETEYREMYSRYLIMQNNYPLRTEMHKEALTTYIKYAFKRDQSIAQDDIEAAEKWGKLAAKQASDAKMNPSQLSAADLSDGISNFSKLVEAVEKVQDIIPILPKYKQAPLDMVDYTIWQYVNYIRRLQNLPTVKYSELYKFLEDRVKIDSKMYSFVSLPPKGDYEDSEKDL